MDIFEQLNECHVIEVNSTITDNFSIDFDVDDDGNPGGYLYLVVRTEDGDVERWYSHRELAGAQQHYDEFHIESTYGYDKLAFFVLTSVSEINQIAP